MCKIQFKVALSISLANTVFLPISHRGYRNQACQNLRETSPAHFFLYSPNFSSYTLTHSTSVIPPLSGSFPLSPSHSSSLTPILLPQRSGPQRQKEGLPYTPKTRMCSYTHTHKCVRVPLCTPTHTCEALARPCLTNDTRHCVRREGWVSDVWSGR